MFKRILAAVAVALVALAPAPAFAAETTLTVATIVPTSTVQTLASANADGSKFAVRSGGRTFLVVANGSGSPINVTMEIQNTSVSVPGVGAITLTDNVVAVAAGATRLIGPIAPQYVDADGFAHVTYSDVTTVTVQDYYLQGLN